MTTEQIDALDQIDEARRFLALVRLACREPDETLDAIGTATGAALEALDRAESALKTEALARVA